MACIAQRCMEYHCQHERWGLWELGCAALGCSMMMMPVGCRLSGTSLLLPRACCLAWGGCFAAYG